MENCDHEFIKVDEITACCNCGIPLEENHQIFSTGFTDSNRYKGYTIKDTSIICDLVGKGIPDAVILKASEYYEKIEKSRRMKTKLHNDLPSIRKKFLYACVYISYIALQIPILMNDLLVKLETDSDNGYTKSESISQKRLKESLKEMKKGIKELSYHVPISVKYEPSKLLHYIVGEILEKDYSFEELVMEEYRKIEDLIEERLENISLINILVYLICQVSSKDTKNLLKKTGVTIVTLNKIKKILGESEMTTKESTKETGETKSETMTTKESTKEETMTTKKSGTDLTQSS